MPGGILAIAAIGIVAAVATTIGEIAVLTMFYISTPEGPEGRTKRRIIDTGYFIGSGLGILVSAAVALGFRHFVPFEYLCWLGIVPIAMGIHYLLRPVADREICKAGTLVDKMRSVLTPLGLYTMLAMVLTLDDLTVYIPLLSVISQTEMVLVLIIAVANIALMVSASRYIRNITSIKCHIDRIQRWLAPMLFILIGVFVLAQGSLF